MDIEEWMNLRLDVLEEREKVSEDRENVVAYLKMLDEVWYPKNDLLDRSRHRRIPIPMGVSEFEDQDRFFGLERLVDDFSAWVEFFPQIIDTTNWKMYQDNFDRLPLFLADLRYYSLNPMPEHSSWVLPMVGRYSDFLGIDLEEVKDKPELAYGVMCKALARRFMMYARMKPEHREEMLAAVLNTRLNPQEMVKGERFRVEDYAASEKLYEVVELFDELHDEVGWFSPEPEVEGEGVILPVVMDLAREVSKDVVVKDERYEVESNEWGKWLDDNVRGRLRRDYFASTFIVEMGEHLDVEWTAPAPLFVTDVAGEQVHYFLERSKGRKLVDLSKGERFVQGKKVMRALAEMHYHGKEWTYGRGAIRDDLPPLPHPIFFDDHFCEWDGDLEFRAICDYVGINVEGIPYDCVREIVGSLPKGFRHGSFHPDQVLLSNGKVEVIDWELCSDGPQYDDLVLFLEGKLGYSVKEKSLLRRTYWKRMGELERFGENQLDFELGYFLRCVPIQLWAAARLLEDEKVSAAKFQMQRSLGAIDTVVSTTLRYRDEFHKGGIVKSIISPRKMLEFKGALMEELTGSRLQSVLPWSL